MQKENKYTKTIQLWSKEFTVLERVFQSSTSPLAVAAQTLIWSGRCWSPITPPSNPSSTRLIRCTTWRQSDIYNFSEFLSLQGNSRRYKYDHNNLHIIKIIDDVSFASYRSRFCIQIDVKSSWNICQIPVEKQDREPAGPWEWRSRPVPCHSLCSYRRLQLSLACHRQSRSLEASGSSWCWLTSEITSTGEYTYKQWHQEN